MVVFDELASDCKESNPSKATRNRQLENVLNLGLRAIGKLAAHATDSTR